MKKETQSKPLHEIILEMFFLESKDKPCKLTKNEVFWKFKDPNINEFQIEQVLNWLVHHKKLNETLGHYTLDKYEAIDIENRLKEEKEKQEKALFNTTTKTVNKPKMRALVINYIAPAAGLSYALYLIFLLNKPHKDFQEILKQIDATTSQNQLPKPKIGYFAKNKPFSDNEIKTLLKNQQQNSLYLYKKIDTLQKQHTKTNEKQHKYIQKLTKNIKDYRNKVDTLFLHILLLLSSLILLLLLRNTT
jgi:hypothetical protein